MAQSKDAFDSTSESAAPAGDVLPPHYAPAVFDFTAWKQRAGFHRDEDVARELDVSRGTLITWKKQGFARMTLLALYALERFPEHRNWVPRAPGRVPRPTG